jgi:hypothetical protein
MGETGANNKLPPHTVRREFRTVLPIRGMDAWN